MDQVGFERAILDYSFGDHESEVRDRIELSAMDRATELELCLHAITGLNY